VTIQGRPGAAARSACAARQRLHADPARRRARAAGFSLDSLTPDQVERIEILRAPTAETGARAIAGTINIITRGGYTRRVNDVRVAAGFENGRMQPSVVVDAQPRRATSSSTLRSACSTSTATTAARRRRSTAASTTARSTLEQLDDGRLRVNGGGVHATARDPVAARRRRRYGDADADPVREPLPLAPRRNARRKASARRRRRTTPAETTARVRHVAGAPERRVDAPLRAGARVDGAPASARCASPVHSFRTEFTNGSESRTLEETSDTHDTTITASGKLVTAILEQHSLVSGIELESNRVPTRAPACRTASRS
jgi:iron complex outermembrane receptor protein